jgi:hypothetical protein
VPRGEIFVTTKVATNITSAQPTGSDGRLRLPVAKDGMEDILRPATGTGFRPDGCPLARWRGGAQRVRRHLRQCE